jgi:GNAT superfamily N-acetyltransferase
MRPSISLSDIHHYIALVDDKPVGVCLWYSYTDIGCLGGTGVLPVYHGKRVATSLAVKAITEAKEQGVNTMMVQTVNPKLERLLRMSGFKTAFTRTRYTL